ncbi:hypothetical protein J2Z83_000080 [Virgibacillus natechei]|uniref:Uncharacterized protein n=1 Tax=Virgibacillus natechei TaxID=1216297 RepID=A0ABS4IAU1_9BACI|nr:hypothetical protein [Virgibacillus natechei]MBP1967988.1 hypothetical protein [Virgibacillus natechei]UZD14726.1 hypothetical protein OLD84_09590 [Virgibacillus natechei]
MEQNKEKLLVIELDKVKSLPRVYYKGEEINMKQKIQFEWETGDESDEGFAEFLIQNVTDDLTTEIAKSIHNSFRSKSRIKGE